VTQNCDELPIIGRPRGTTGLILATGHRMSGSIVWADGGTDAVLRPDAF
jgi:hypothetical protein